MPSRVWHEESSREGKTAKRPCVKYRWKSRNLKEKPEVAGKCEECGCHDQRNEMFLEGSEWSVATAAAKV